MVPITNGKPLQQVWEKSGESVRRRKNVRRPFDLDPTEYFCSLNGGGISRGGEGSCMRGTLQSVRNVGG